MSALSKQSYLLGSPSKEFVTGGGATVNLVLSVVRFYTAMLESNPLITKSVTCSGVAALGNVISQVMQQKNGKDSKVKRDDFNNNVFFGDMTLLPRPILNFALFGLGVIGPITHYFFKYLDVYVPPSAKASTKLSRILVERLLLAPVLSISTIVSLGLLQGQGKQLPEKLRFGLIPLLIANWKVWTVPQYVNVNFVPQQFRVLFANMVSLVWNVYLSSIEKKSIKSNNNKE